MASRRRISTCGTTSIACRRTRCARCWRRWASPPKPIPQRFDAASIDWTLAEESGASRAGTVAVKKLAALARTTHDHESFVARELVLDADPPPGYHRLTIRSGKED